MGPSRALGGGWHGGAGTQAHAAKLCGQHPQSIHYLFVHRHNPIPHVLSSQECMDLDPEYLPRRLLTDFSIYNAEVGGGWWGGGGGQTYRVCWFLRLLVLRHGWHG